MIAICRSSLGEAIPPSKRYLGETDQTEYSPLVVGKSYAVYGLLFISDRVDYLVRTPDQPPFWVPGNLFDLADSGVPTGWEFCITHLRDGYKDLLAAFKINYIVGYPLLVNEYKHYVGLAERDPEEVRRFIECVLVGGGTMLDSE
ncbi:hypothetical protein [Pseudomonas costantinii]|uniref:hypothetical protein n=1 Tax=Pseudomonas costantinii TaxID=168469 RepID=UPI0015A2AFB4|nr:hypothetical protein [Pseudomonas costantinii]NVZ70435.1 hypothetical protein [Pseudomonas costantinii]